MFVVISNFRQQNQDVSLDVDTYLWVKIHMIQVYFK